MRRVVLPFPRSSHFERWRGSPQSFEQRTRPGAGHERPQKPIGATPTRSTNFPHFPTSGMVVDDDAFRPHQIAGSEWLASAGTRLGLFDDTGTGKTATAIRGAWLLAPAQVLVLVPSIVLVNWQREVEKWWPERRGCVQLVDTTKTRLRDGAPSIVVCTHGLSIVPAIAQQLRERRWGLLVVDEAHQFRGPEAKRTNSLYRLGFAARWGNPSPLVEQCDRVWLLTATPMPNNCSELWTHVRGLWPEALSDATGKPLTYAGFLQRFCRVRETIYGPKVIGNKNVEQLRALLVGKFLRRKKADVLAELPSIRFETVTLMPKELPWELEAIENRLRPKIVAALAERDTGTPGAAWQALRAEEDHARFRQLCGLAKVKPVAELVGDELETKAIDKVLMFAWHVEVVEALAAELAGFGAVCITGGTSAAQRAELVDRFQNDPTCRVLVGNITAAGVGATLTAACEVVFVEMSYVPGDNRQAADRAHRMGQNEKVRVRCVALAHTADEELTANLRNKTRMIREVLR